MLNVTLRTLLYESVFDWLIRTGAMWLENADARADDRWRIDYNILVRRHP